MSLWARYFLGLAKKAAGLQDQMLQVLPVAQAAADVAALLRLLERPKPNTENVFSTFWLLHSGHSMGVVDDMPRTNFSNLVPQDWQTYS